VIAWAGFYSMFFFVTLYMQNVLGYSPLRSGLSYVPVSAGIAFGSTVATKMFVRTGTRPIIVSGALLAAGGILWLSRIPVDGTYLGNLVAAGAVALRASNTRGEPATTSKTQGDLEPSLLRPRINTP
jgi:predicted MFS family arabinose efflux permease